MSIGSLCEYCRDRIERNPLRLLDCKEQRCQDLLKDAPGIHQYLCPECRGHFQKVRELLRVAGISFRVNERLVRGLDYYTQTAFEVSLEGWVPKALLPEEGATITSLKPVGFSGARHRGGYWAGAGTHRTGKLGVELPSSGRSIFCGHGRRGSFRGAGKEAMSLLVKLRRAGYPAEKDFLSRSLKAQMKQAGRLGSRFVVILGTEEMKEGKLPKDMERGSQINVTQQELFRFLENRKSGEAEL